MLIASGSKGSLFLMCIVVIFSCLIYYKLYLDSPSIKQHFEEKAFQLNFTVFRNAIFHSHLYFKIKESNGCNIDCWKNGVAGLDFNRYGYPIATRYQSQNIGHTEVDLLLPKNNSDCAAVWVFLMGPLHKNINSKKSKYQASFNRWTESCDYKNTYFYNSKITYTPKLGNVTLKNVYEP